MLRHRLRISTFFALGLTLLLAIGVPTALCQAATISYGNFGPIPPGINFLDVEESSGTDPVPLYGPPVPFAIGMDFNPSNFVATANGGAIDVTDGQLNFTITGTNAFPINTVTLQESGDYGVDGVGTIATKAKAFVNIQATIKEINGVAVSPLAFPITPSNNTVEFKLGLVPNDGGWTLGTILNLASQLGPNQKVTKVDIAIDNRLTAFSEAATLAFIAKKDFLVGVTTNEIPEPTAMMLAIGCCVGLVSLARRRQR